MCTVWKSQEGKYLGNLIIVENIAIAKFDLRTDLIVTYELQYVMQVRSVITLTR
jgi:hypothetical protein